MGDPMRGVKLDGILARGPLSRRGFLRGMLGGAAVSIALPWLETLAGKRALAQGSFPTRFGLFWWGNGMRPDAWTPTGEGAGDAWQLSELLQPLAPVKDRITVVSGTALKVPNDIPHHSGTAGSLTGMPLWVKSHEDQTMNGPTIDQRIAADIGGETRFRSLEVGLYPNRHTISYNGPDNKNPPEVSPAALFERLFGPEFRAPGEATEVDPKLALRRSVLDAVAADIGRFQRGLSAADRVRLDQHLTGVRELERRIARLEADPPDLAACLRPEAPVSEYDYIEGKPQIPAKSRVMADLAVMALACDQTRVFSFQVNSPIQNLQIAGSDQGFHNLTHDEPEPQVQVKRIVTSIMEEYTYMIQRLDAVDEGGESLLDHMALLATSDISFGRTHSLDEFPIVIAGTANGRLRAGLHYRSPFAENTSMVMLSLIRACGVNAGSWGAEGGYVEDGLGAIEA